MKGLIQPLRTAAFSDYVRILVIYDRQTNGALPAIADILQTTSQTGANTNSVFSDINLNNRDRFMILRDMRVVLPSLTVTAGVVTNPGFVDPVTGTFFVKEYIKLKGLITQYRADSSAAVIGDIASGGLFLVTFGQTAAGMEGFNSFLETRLRYGDK